MTLHTLAAVFLAWLPRDRRPEVRIDADGVPRWEKTAFEQRSLREEDHRLAELHLKVSRPF